MSDPKDSHPRHIRIGRTGGEDEAVERRRLQFSDRVTVAPTTRPMPILLVLALIVVVGALIGRSYLRSVDEDAAAPVAEAPEGFGPVSPSGEASRGLVIFAWGPRPGATGYEVELSDAAGQAIWTARVGPADNRLALPEDMALSLSPGGAYLWRVTAELPEGGREPSPPLAFVVR